MIKHILKLVFIGVSITAIIITGLITADILLSRNPLEMSELRLVVELEDGTNFGSAVIFDEDDDHYYALTNDHVVEGASSIKSLDYENNQYVTYVISKDSSFDLAVISIDKSIKLAVIEFADDFSVYDEVKAVGYPTSMYRETDGSITAYQMIDYDISFAVITHSASISQGSSGGALVNNDGELVGINFAGYFEDNQTLTEGYAIPINQVRTYLEGVSLG